jgi:hypothetical protein
MARLEIDCHSAHAFLVAHSTAMAKRNVVAILIFVGAALAARPGQAQSYRGEAVPVVVRANSIEFLDDLEFLTLAYGHGGPMYAPLDTPPVMGREYFIEVDIFGIESAASIRFELVDSEGRSLQTLTLWKSSDDSSDGEFNGLMRVPDQPFRAVASGTIRGGAAFRSAADTLIQPASTGPDEQLELPAGAPPSQIAQMQAMVTAGRQQLQARAAQAAADHPDGVISLARAVVSPISYEPLNSTSGDPIGMRLRYSIRFPTRQTIAAVPHVISEYQQAWRVGIEMKPLGGTITPAPRMGYEGQPLRDAIVYKARATYEANTTYTFMVDLVPNYVLQGTQTGRFCINEQTITNRAAWEAIMSSEAEVRYSVSIRDTETRANIPAFFPQRTFHETFTAGGALDCGPTGNTRF